MSWQWQKHGGCSWLSRTPFRTVPKVFVQGPCGPTVSNQPQFTLRFLREVIGQWAQTLYEYFWHRTVYNGKERSESDLNRSELSLNQHQLNQRAGSFFAGTVRQRWEAGRYQIAICSNPSTAVNCRVLDLVLIFKLFAERQVPQNAVVFWGQQCKPPNNIPCLEAPLPRN
jgi:hypothetical protein